MPPPEPSAFTDRVQDGLAGRAPFVSPQAELAEAEESFLSLTLPAQISLFAGDDEDGDQRNVVSLDSYLKVRLAVRRERTRSR